MKDIPLLNGTVDRLIMDERKNIQKYLAGQIYLDIEIEKTDKKVLEDMEEEIVWLKREVSRKI